MDGIDEPPLRKKWMTKKFNTFVDALYVIPQRIFGKKIRLRPPAPRKEQIYFIGACNVPLQSLDPALTRPGRLGRHIYFRTPTWEDRRDVFDLYITKVAHEDALDTPKARDELARITAGYSPAMIDQVCSLALTYAHSDGRPVFSRKDILEAMTTVEAGVAIGQTVPEARGAADRDPRGRPRRLRASYMENGMSTRLSIRKRGSYAAAITRWPRSRIASCHWRSEEVGGLIWRLGAYAAEHMFYGQNTTGVGGDLGSVTHHAAHMVASPAWRRRRSTSRDRIADREEREAEEERVMERFEKIGYQLMHRSGAARQRVHASLGDPEKRKLVAGLLGQCVRDRLEHDPREPRRHRDGGRTADRGRRALRRRRRRAPQRTCACASPRSTSWMTVMARDLIPPPSPAGRPQPEGTPRLVELPPEPPPAAAARRSRRGRCRRPASATASGS